MSLDLTSLTRRFVARLVALIARDALRGARRAAGHPVEHARRAAAALAVAGLAGCLSACVSGQAARGEPAGGATLVLTVNGDNYEIHRSYTGEQTWSGDPLVVPRSSVPADCAATRFFLNDANHALRVAEPEFPAWVTAATLPRPGPEFPPCSLLVSYGEFAGPPALEGLFVTGPDGLVAKARRKPSQPAYLALAPLEAVAEVWLVAGAVLATPVLVPGGLVAGRAESEWGKKERAEAESTLPPEVVACWRAADHAMALDVGGPANPFLRFTAFRWRATKAGAYILTPGAASFGADPPVSVDAQVTLRFGRVKLRNTDMDLSTDAEFDCGLVAGTVVASRIRLRD